MLQFSRLIHTAEIALYGRNFVLAGRVDVSLDRAADGRRSGDTHRSQHQPCLESHFELKLNERFKSAAVYLITASLCPCTESAIYA